MPQLLLGLLVLIGLALVLRWFATANPAALAGTIRAVAIGFGAIAGVGVVLAMLARNPLVFLEFAPFLLPFLYWLWRRWRAKQSLGAGWGSPHTQSSATGGVSRVRTAWLEMSLNHTSGEMTGMVLHGAHAGRSLDGLPEPSLLELLGECADDDDSVRVLEAYLDRRFGPDWRRRASARAGASGADAGTPPPRQPRDGP